MARGVEIGRGYIAVEVDEDGARSALKGFVGFAGSAFKAAAATAGVLIGAAAKIGIEFNSMKEQAMVAFSTLLGSGEKAQAFLQNLTTFAAQTPFELPGLIDNARSLLGVGLAADKVIPTMGALGNAAGALGLNQDAFNRVMIATVQAMGKGKLQGDELLQMVEAGIPVWTLLSKATGKTVPELQKMSEQGKLLSADVLPKLFDQMNKDYGGAMAAQSKTLVGTWSSLKDNARILAATGFKPIFDEAKNVVGVLGELAASDKAKRFAENFATDLQKGIAATKVFGQGLKREFGDDVTRVLDQLKKSAGEAWDTFKQDGVPTLKALAQAAISVLPSLLQLAQAASGLLRPALEAIRTVLDAVSANAGNFANLVRTAAQTVSAIAGPAFKVLGEVLKAVGVAVAGVVDIIGTFATPIGLVAGGVIAATVAMRAFHVVAGSVAAVGSTVGGALSSFAKRADDVALSAGVMTERFTKSASAGEKVAVAGGKVGGALRAVGNNLPLIGAGFLVLAGAWGLASQRAEDLANNAKSIGQGLAVGGTAAKDAARKLSDLEKSVVDTKKAMADLEKGTTTYGDRSGVADAKSAELNRRMNEAKSQIKGAAEELKRYEAELGPVGLAQARVSQATTDYNAAVKEFGPTSVQAIDAQQRLVGETRQLDQAQRNAANAAKSQEQSLYDMATAALAAADSGLQLKQAQLAVKDALTNLNTVQNDAKASVNDRQRAELELESAVLRSAAAARKKAEADAVARGETDTSKAANKAYADELLRLGLEAGSNAPAALQRLIANGLDPATARAIGARVSVDSLGNAVIRLPDGREIKISAENAQALQALKQVQDEQDRIERQIKIRITTDYGGGIQSNTAQLARDARSRAVGGPIQANAPVRVGELGEEIIFPDRAGYVATARQAQSIMAGLKSNSGTIQQINNFSAPMDESAYAASASQKLAWLAKTGGK